MSAEAADGKRAMTEDDARILNRLARIEGHTGTKGEAATNLYVSLAIAQVVESWLGERGAPASAIEVVGLGGSFPPANQGADPRRIEIVLLVP